MVRLAFILVVVAACDVGTYGEVGGGGGGGGGGLSPDASSGGGGGKMDAATGGGGANVAVTFTTSPTGTPQYAPNNIAVVWVENSAGAIMKTIGRYADIRRQSLVAWTLKAGLNDVDAVTSATRTSHAQPLTVTWDLRDRNNAVVPDGTYTIRMEVADRNATQPNENNQGTFTFVKGTSPQSQTALSNGGFTNVSITFTP